MKQKPQLTDDEIRSHMDFDKLLQLNQEVVLIKSKIAWIKLSAYLVPIAATIATIFYFTTKNEIDQASNQNPESEQVVPVDSIHANDQQTVADSRETEDVSLSKESSDNSGQNVVKPTLKQEPKTFKKSDSTQKISIAQFTEAEPIDGYPALYEYFNRELTYPKEIAKDSVEGTVIVSFKINVDGKPGDIKIVSSLGNLFDKESIRVIENMPKWKAATINGDPTATRLSIPLTFKILK